MYASWDWITTHLNTEHLHCHFVVNSVSFRDGKRLQNKEKAWWYFRHIADEVCLEHGLSVVQNPEAYQSPRILTQKDKAGMKDIAFSLQKVVTNAAIKDTPMISVPVPTALPYFGTSSSLTFLRL